MASHRHFECRILVFKGDWGTVWWLLGRNSNKQIIQIRKAGTPELTLEHKGQKQQILKMYGLLLSIFKSKVPLCGPAAAR